ncbi:hypothetical protein G7Y89_g209 [Cudoniella acicularis]|uniref:Uncharacterized protein n=1 Tax=Cudoniella acicularis TaxID=354080 RepID=A0A8H4RZ79_9HELO|nr:hypothetical protein G7Y89_g209 [Cudoniella acicularis]
MLSDKVSGISDLNIGRKDHKDRRQVLRTICSLDGGQDSRSRELFRWLKLAADYIFSALHDFVDYTNIYSLDVTALQRHEGPDVTWGRICKKVLYYEETKLRREEGRGGPEGALYTGGECWQARARDKGSGAASQPPVAYSATLSESP